MVAENGNYSYPKRRQCFVAGNGDKMSPFDTIVEENDDNLVLNHERYRQTDGRTDDMRSQYRALHYSASRGENYKQRKKMCKNKNKKV